ncbi:MAG: NADH-quinone oxidoreductase subunit A [Anaerolineae bacterium]|nr:NADH-quinone oxidoreductase subunit A [Anaerolineae bacterium]
MADEYAFFGIFMAVALVFSVAPIILAWFLSPKKLNPRKQETYECGIETFGRTWIEFKPQYYLFALAFMVFDAEAALLLPWAVAYNALPLYAVIEAVIFLLILGFGLVYVWAKGWLHWV